MPIHNPNCDGSKCRSEHGEVRVLPLNGDANLIVCFACYDDEMRYRRDRNKYLSPDCRFDQPDWYSLEPYNTD